MAHRNGDRRNQLLFREVNKRIREVSDGLHVRVEFLCECGHADCTATVEAMAAQFDELLSDDGRFLIAREHQSLNGQPVIADYGDYLVLRAEAALEEAER
jgi:hypothetical protein